MKEIAVVSKNKVLSRLIELEAASCGAATKLFTSVPKDTDGFSVVFVDVDSVEISATRFGANVIEISTGFAEDSSRRLSYPPSLIAIREYILSSGQIKVIRKKVEPVADKRIAYFDHRKSLVRIDGEEYPLSEYEMKLLCYLCDRATEAVSRAELSELLGAEKGNICDVYVCHLRKKLEKNGDRRVIYTVRNKGYMTKYKSAYQSDK